MNKQTEALKLALEALGEIHVGNMTPMAEMNWNKAITAIREALAEQQEPDLSHLRKETQEAIRGWIKDGTFFDRAIGTMHDQEKLLMAYEKAQQQEPVAWMPIEQMYPQGKAIDILMGDGSILCAVLPQFDGDLWWEGSGTGEKFIDPKYANVTHWRIHNERTSPPASKPWVGLTEEERNAIERKHGLRYFDEVFHDIDAKLREKNA